MLNYKTFSWVYKARYWTAADGKQYWLSPETLQVEEFSEQSPAVGPGPHEKIHEPKMIVIMRMPEGIEAE